MAAPRATFAVALAIGLAGCDPGLPTPAPPQGCIGQGIDVSRHQGDIDWRAVARAGVRFAWIKATEGGDHLDAKFRRNWLLARDAGVRRGAYHFVYWCRPARDQGAWFAANVPDDPDALPPVLDVEWNPGSRSCPNKVPRDVAVADVKVMLEQMQRTYGRRPIIYAPADLYREVLQGAFADYPLWVRRIGTQSAADRGAANQGPEDYGDRPWLIWQYSETGSVPGISGAVDRNCLNPSRSDAKALLTP